MHLGAATQDQKIGPESPTGSLRVENTEMVTPVYAWRRGDDRHPSKTSTTQNVINVIIPKIRQPNEKDIIAKFQYKKVDVIDVKPMYNLLRRAQKQTSRKRP